jgi:hypothetical protein
MTYRYSLQADDAARAASYCRKHPIVARDADGTIFKRFAQMHMALKYWREFPALELWDESRAGWVPLTKAPTCHFSRPWVPPMYRKSADNPNGWEPA